MRVPGPDCRISIYDAEAVERLRGQLALDPRHIRDLRTQLCKHFSGSTSAVTRLPRHVREMFEECVDFHPLSLEKRIDSAIDGATKLVFRTAGGYLVETVILRTETGRTSLCVSSQVGCAAACTFCATGYMGVAKNLSAAEIVDQLVQAGELLQSEDRRVRNVVFMGMGEPLHNEEQVNHAIETLLAPEWFHHPSRYLLVSTVGIPDAMIRFARRFPTVNLALSLHSTRQEIRQQIVPLAKRYDVTALHSAIDRINAVQGRPVLIEYLMLRGINDSPADAASLIEYVHGLNVHVNLIPYNPIDAAPQLVGSDRPTRDAFAGQLKAAGVTTTIRYSLGADIAAACGQLVQGENRVVASRSAKRYTIRGANGDVSE